MFPYLLLATCTIFLAFLASVSVRWKSQNYLLNFLNPFYVVMVIILVAFSGLRVGIGLDYPFYVRNFERLDAENWTRSLTESSQELGFAILSLLVKSLGGNAEDFILILSFLTVMMVMITIHLARVNLVIAVSAYILFAHYLSPMNIARQGLAVALVFAAVVLYRRSVWGSLLAVVFAVLAIFTHVSAVFIVPVFLILKLFPLRLHRVVMITLLVWFGGAAVARIPFVLNLLGSLNERYVDYVASTDVSGIGSYLVAILHLSIGAYFLRLNIWKGAFKWYLDIYLLTGPFYLLGTEISWAARLGEFSSIFLVLLLPHLARAESKSKKFIFFIFCIGIGYYLMHLQNWGGLLPYSSQLHI